MFTYMNIYKYGEIKLGTQLKLQLYWLAFKCCTCCQRRKVIINVTSAMNLVSFTSNLVHLPSHLPTITNGTNVIGVTNHFYLI